MAERGAQDATQTTAYPSHDGGGGRINEAFLVVAVCDRGAVAVEGRQASLCLPTGTVSLRRRMPDRESHDLNPDRVLPNVGI